MMILRIRRRKINTDSCICIELESLVGLDMQAFWYGSTRAGTFSTLDPGVHAFYLFILHICCLFIYILLTMLRPLALRACGASPINVCVYLFIYFIYFVFHRFHVQIEDSPGYQSGHPEYMGMRPLEATYTFAWTKPAQASIAWRLYLKRTFECIFKADKVARREKQKNGQQCVDGESTT